MKAKLYVCIILTALIAVFTISGCTEESTIVDKLAASTDEVIANVIENVHDETGTTTTAVTTTVAPTETTVGETTTAPETTTEAEEVAETKTNQTSDKATASNADKTENNASTQKPNNTSNSNTSGNTTSNTTTNKSNGNTNGNTNTSSNTSNNTTKPKPVETQVPTTEAPVVITDDTPLTFEQMNTAENMQKIVDYCNAYFETLGMTYNEELDPSWAGWYYGRQGGLRVFDVSSVNEQKKLTAGMLKQQVDAILIDYDGYEYTDITYKTVYVVNELDGYYDIVFCYG